MSLTDPLDVPSGRRSRPAGLAPAFSLVLSGVLSVPVGLLTFAYPPAIADTLWGHPFPRGVHVGVAVVLLVAHALTAYGFVGLARLPGGRVVTWSMGAVAVGFLVVAVCEGISATLWGTSTEAAAAINLENGYGAGSMLLAVASVVGGVAIIRRRLLPGISRWSVILSGLFMIFVVTPALIAGRGDPAYLALTGWSLFFIWIGIALGRRVRDTGDGPR
ncbi:hypothetical protein [Zhihengliuella salsuginis]|uniref:DUF998 domain-containing protein n=1 Tax=Zhihengliuella salsuginis TaxID=578222 RepID=A0ABQ3GFI2_9MICC|nr:hypothetical protein [Zhihengliuella salsuginis]GHD04016.1 hypothetical protein GCM10008096_10810 [Zhihengliuella salsuginis]